MSADSASPDRFTEGDPLRVSFVVPTRDSERTILACLSSLRDQTYGNVEVIVVDNFSTDTTALLAGRVADAVLTGGPERSAQRNIGAAAASGGILVFIDSDMRAPRNLAKEIVGGFDRLQTSDALVLPEISIGEGYWAKCKRLEKLLYMGDPAVEAARAFRADPFWDVGGFDEELHAGEDWDLSDRLRASGRSIARAAVRIAHDDARLSLIEDIRKKYYYGQSLRSYFRQRPRQVLPKLVRVAFLRRSDLLLRHPLLGVGLVVMKGLQLAAVSGGAVVSIAGSSARSATRDRREERKEEGGTLADAADSYAARHPQLGSRGDLPPALSVALKAVAAGSDLVIDVGCGEGQTLGEVQRLLGIRSPLIGFDISHSRGTLARARGFDLVTADALRLPLSTGSVALAICQHTIEHVSDDQQLLVEISRVLRPEGTLYLETPLRLRGAWYPYRNPDGQWVLDPTHVREYQSVAEVAGLLRAAGLTPIRWSLAPIRYPLAHLVHRVIRLMGLPGLPARYLNKGHPSARIPRYREIRVVARADSLEEQMARRNGRTLHNATESRNGN